MFASLEHYSLWELSESCVTVRREPRTEPCGSPPDTSQPANTETFPSVLEMRSVSRKPKRRWKEFKRKDCQILLHLSELLSLEERQWEQCFCQDFCPTSHCIPLPQFSLSLFAVYVLSLSFFLFHSLYVFLSVCLSAWLSVRSLVYSPSASEFAAMAPTSQPTDDVDIYFETPADDKEHSRFQRAKEQLEIRHRNRMERVSYQVESRTLLP